jgi:CheY-like chemotaxis protein
METSKILPGEQTVLVVDDDRDAQEILTRTLQSAGYRVVAVGSGAKGLEVVARERVDVILLDVMMPGMTGWEVARRLKEDGATAGIPLVFLSARTQEEDRRKGEELGVAAYVSKPFDPVELVDTIRRLTGRA